MNLLQRITAIYRYLHSSNVDSVVGGIALTCLASWSYRQPVSIWDLLCLATAMWSIYTMERLGNSWQARHGRLSDRHQWHRHHYRLLIPLILSCGFCAFYIAAFKLPAEVLFWGVVLAAISVLHTFLQRFFWYGMYKDFVMAGIYTWGIFLLPIIHNGGLDEIGQYHMGIAYGVVVLNLWIYASFEADYDASLGLASIVSLLGKARFLRLLGSFWLVLIVCILGLIASNGLMGYWILLMMTLLLGAVLIFEPLLRANYRYRLISEAIFYLPFLSFFLY